MSEEMFWMNNAQDNRVTCPYFKPRRIWRSRCRHDASIAQSLGNDYCRIRVGKGLYCYGLAVEEELKSVQKLWGSK